MLAFGIWAAVGCVFLGVGVFAFFAKKPMGFWANQRTFAVNDVAKYNRAVGKCWCVYALAFILLGLPLLAGQNSPLVMISILGVVLASISLMVVYLLVITPKYQKKDS